MDLSFINKEDAPDFPKILYKYRTWSKEEHKRLLTEGEIYYASPNDFNEVTECNLERDYDSVTDEMIWNYCRKRALYEAEKGKILISNIEVRTRDLYESNTFHDLENRKENEREFRESLNNSLSVFSASESSTNERLWSTFASERRGYCVGINFSAIYKNEDIFGSCGRVNYYDEKNPPKILPLSFSPQERISNMMQIIYSLPNKFKEEEEFRFTKMHISQKTVQLKPEWISEVILGSEISNKDESEIVRLVKSKYPNTELKKLFVEPTFGYHTIVNYESK